MPGQQRRGLVNGYIVALYPMGAMIATPAFHACNEAFGWRITLAGLSAVLVACGAAAALARPPVGYDSASPAGVAQLAEQPSCKRQVSGSIPLTGSESSIVLTGSWPGIVDRRRNPR